MYKRIVRKRNFFNPFLRTYLLELRLRWKKILLFSIIFVVFTLLTSFFYPYHFDEIRFFRYEINYFRFLIIFISCFFFSDIVCSEFSLKTGYIIYIDRMKIYREFKCYYSFGDHALLDFEYLHYGNL